VQKYKNKRTIIIGEVNTGKTTFLYQILKGFLEEGETHLAVIDLAPESVKNIGGKMRMEGLNSIRYCTAQIVAPRLTGKTSDEVEKLAKQNVKLIDHIFRDYSKNPAKVLLINDVSIYLQTGDLDKILSLLKTTPTVIMNGYYGSSLGGGELGKRERENMDKLQEQCDLVIKLYPN